MKKIFFLVLLLLPSITLAKKFSLSNNQIKINLVSSGLKYRSAAGSVNLNSFSLDWNFDGLHEFKKFQKLGVNKKSSKFAVVDVFMCLLASNGTHFNTLGYLSYKYKNGKWNLVSVSGYRNINGRGCYSNGKSLKDRM